MIEFIQTLLHIDVTLLALAQEYGTFLYIILFLIIFCETGLVVTPFLPGDSLLFAIGALAASKQIVDLALIIPLLIFAASIGDSLNYFIGRKWGTQLFTKNILFLNPKYLNKTEEFFEKRGVWAVSLSRFFPIIRTFSPFFAGISQMPYLRFLTLSVLGSVVWINLFTLAGYFFGQIEIIRNNFTVLVLSVVILSLTPIVISVLKANLQKKSA